MKNLDEVTKKLFSLLDAKQEVFSITITESPSVKTIDTALKILKLLAGVNVLPRIVTNLCKGGVSLVFSQQANELYLRLNNDDSMCYVIDDLAAAINIENEKNIASVDEAVKIVKDFCLG